MPTLADQPAQPAAIPPVGAMSPLWPLLTLLGVAAVAIGALFSRLSPAAPAAAAPEARFTDVTRAAGLILPADPDEAGGGPGSLGGAVAFLDYDGDGRPDLLYVGGGGCALFHNEGGGRFRETTRAAGLDPKFAGMSIAVGDYDNDGRPDIYITGIGGNRLYHNLGQGRFADVTVQSEVGGDDHVWSMGAVWLDLAGEGRLDLVVCNYARWSRESDFRSALAAAQAGPSYGTPRAGFVSCFPTVYRNLGDGRFADVTRQTGLEKIDRQTGFPRAYPLAVAAVDAGQNGRLDLLFSYQSGDDVLFLNQGRGVFKEWTPSAERREGVSAGLAAASDPWFAQRIANGERLAVLRESGFALNPAAESGDSLCHLRDKLGVALLDYDLDGRIDVLSGNGLAESGLELFDFGQDFAVAPSLLWNDGRRWTAAPAGDGPLSERSLLRGIAVADVYGNGRLAVAIASNGGPLRLLRNDLNTRHAWLRIDLVGTRGPRDAGGARVEVQTPRRVYLQTMEPAMGFMAQSESTLTFGLGDDARVNRIVVHWPSGVRQEIRSPEVDRRLLITEPAR